MTVIISKFIILDYYCQSVRHDWFWQFDFRSGNITLECLLREPAYIFQEMVSVGVATVTMYNQFQN